MGDKKTNFSLTCSLLSQYLKNNGALPDLSLQIPTGSLGKSRALPTTMSLLPGVDICEENQAQDCPKSVDVKKLSNIKEAQQLTIFYQGKVLVFDDFPADKANDLFQIASKEITCTATQNVGFKVPPAPKVESIPTKSIAILPSISTSVVAPENILPKPANPSDMPIARRNSLHRFLEKRKDRISTKAPYQVHGGFSSAENAAKNEDGPSWLGLGRQSSKLGNSSGNSE